MVPVLLSPHTSSVFPTSLARLTLEEHEFELDSFVSQHQVALLCTRGSSQTQMQRADGTHWVLSYVTVHVGREHPWTLTSVMRLNHYLRAPGMTEVQGSSYMWVFNGVGGSATNPHMSPGPTAHSFLGAA